MKLIRFGEAGKEKPGVLIGEKRFDVSSLVTDFNEAFFEENGIETLKAALDKNPALPEVDASVRLGSPVARPSKIICIGLNYVDHCVETGAPIPKEPILFFKSTASYVEEADAMDYVAGYCLHNDYSERGFQLERGGQWAKGKGCDTFAPLGPFLATTDEIADVDNLSMWLTVNGKTYQNSNTSNLVFKIPFLVHYLSQFMTLLPGDIISTGTPPGVCLGIKPNPVYLKAGDVIELGMEGLGSSKQIAVAYSK